MCWKDKKNLEEQKLKIPVWLSGLEERKEK